MIIWSVFNLIDLSRYWKKTNEDMVHKRPAAKFSFVHLINHSGSTRLNHQKVFIGSGINIDQVGLYDTRVLAQILRTMLLESSELYQREWLTMKSPSNFLYVLVVNTNTKQY